MISLQPIGQYAEQEMSGQVGRRCPPERRPPAGPKGTDVAIAQVRDLDIERPRIRRCRTDLDTRHAGQAARRLVDLLPVFAVPL